MVQTYDIAKMFSECMLKCSLRSRCITGLGKSGKKKEREEEEGAPAIKAIVFATLPTSSA